MHAAQEQFVDLTTALSRLMTGEPASAEAAVDSLLAKTEQRWLQDAMAVSLTADLKEAAVRFRDVAVRAARLAAEIHHERESGELVDGFSDRVSEVYQDITTALAGIRVAVERFIFDDSSE